MNFDLHRPNVVDVCVSNASTCAKNYSITIVLDGPTCRWTTQLQLMVAPGTTSCLDEQAPSQCAFNFGPWCVRVEVRDGSGLCDLRRVCRDFCSEPPPPWNVIASDGEDCDGVLVTWRQAGGFSPPSYVVYRSVVPGGCGGGIAQTGGNSYFDSHAASNTTYYYSVRAITPCGRSSCSNTDSGFRGILPLDWTGDCAVRLDDYAVFASCMTGPELPFAPGCEVFDSDLNDVVDLADVAALQRAFTEP